MKKPKSQEKIVFLQCDNVHKNVCEKGIALWHRSLMPFLLCNPVGGLRTIK